MSSSHSDDPQFALQMRQAATDHELWKSARDVARSGHAKAQEILAVCERIHRTAAAEADRLISLADELPVRIEGDASGQLHLVGAHATNREAARSFISLAVADDYMPWQTPENGAKEIFLRSRNELTLHVRWPESRLRQRIPPPIHAERA